MTVSWFSDGGTLILVVILRCLGPIVLSFCMSVTSFVFSSLLFFHWKAFSLTCELCLPVFLRKISFSCCSWTLCPFCLVECSFHRASLHFCGVFSCCVEDWATMPHHPFTLLLWASLSLQAISYLTDPSVGFHDTLLCFLSLSSLFDCLVLAS